MVNILDLDINFHMNNGRYLSVMDIARLDLMHKSHVLYKIFLKGYYPVIKSESIRFKKSLILFQSFEIDTQIVSWDEQDIYLSQQFMRKSEIIAEGFVKARFKKRGRKGPVSSAEIFSLVGIEFNSINLSSKAFAQNEIESILTKS